MTHTTREKFLWAGYSFEQERAWKQRRSELTEQWKNLIKNQ